MFPSPRGDELFPYGTEIEIEDFLFPSPRGDELFPEISRIMQQCREFPSPRGDELFLDEDLVFVTLLPVSVPSRG